jgi:hypothetical protein
VIADQREAQREDRAADALHGPAGDHQGEAVGDRGDGAAEAHRGERAEHDPAFAVQVGQPAQQRGGDRRAEQERGEDPGGAGRGGAELALEDPEGGHHQRLQHRVGGGGQAEAGQDGRGPDSRGEDGRRSVRDGAAGRVEPEILGHRGSATDGVPVVLRLAGRGSP